MRAINNYNPNFTGRFVVKGNLSSHNKALFERFKKHVQNEISNKASLLSMYYLQAWLYSSIVFHITPASCCK